VNATLTGPFAQTNVALAVQLQALGWSEADRLAVRRGYELAMRLFTGHFRPNGNTFLAHLVRTASILAAVPAPTPVVVAGLLHAAYTHGEFGDGRRPASADKRAEVRAAIGDESERLVHRYGTLPWRDVVSARSARALSAEDQVVMLVRLANELDEGLEATGPDVSPSDAERAGNKLRACAETARDLGHATLAGALDEVGVALGHARLAGSATAAAGTWAASPGAVYYHGPRGSFVLAPRSHRQRPIVALRRRARASPLVRTLYGMARSLLARPPRAS
jgi:hypothetical protein